MLPASPCPTDGCNFNQSARLDTASGEWLLSFSSPSVRLLFQWSVRWSSTLLSCLDLFVFCVFSNPVAPQTREKRFKTSHFKGMRHS